MVTYRGYIYIALLFLCSTVQCQRLIPGVVASSVQSDEYRVYIFQTDWEDITIQDTIPQDTLDLIFANSSIQSEETAGEIANAEFVSYDGSMKLRANLPTDQCCIYGSGAYSEPCASYWNGGAGYHFEYCPDSVLTAGTAKQELYARMDIEVSEGLEMADVYGAIRLGYGFRNGTPNQTGSDVGGMMRFILQSTSDPDEYRLLFYVSSYYYDAVDGWDYHTRPSTVIDTLNVGQKYTLTMRAYMGDTDTYNGFLEAFVNDTLAASLTGQMFKTTSVSNCNYNITRLTAQGYSGGCAAKEVFTSGGYVWNDDWDIFYYEPGISGVPYGSTQSTAGRVLL
jgi:hypothetical protein